MTITAILRMSDSERRSLLWLLERAQRPLAEARRDGEIFPIEQRAMERDLLRLRMALDLRGEVKR